jgi:hypothetical protein
MIRALDFRRLNHDPTADLNELSARRLNFAAQTVDRTLLFGALGGYDQDRSA